MFQKFKNVYHFGQALFAALLFFFPSRSISVIGVTGTDGKTTTVNMIYHILKSTGKKVSMISSLGATIGNKTLDTGFHVSTPNPFQVQKLLREAVNAGSEYLVLEATSHGLDQNRLAFVNFKAGVVTNITSEHLDYHKNMDEYISAKAKLPKSAQIAVLNMDDPTFPILKSLSRRILSTFSLNNRHADVNLSNFPIMLKSTGTFNIYNALAAAAVCKSVKISKNDILSALKSFHLPEGRMQHVSAGQKFTAIVDFAHTENGLKNVLESLRKELPKDGKLIAVFGSAGDRFKEKRQKMGSVAGRLADLVVITSEDPRKENPQQILSAIASGLKSQGKKEDKDFFTVADRKKAIEFAVKKAGPNDIVGFFGKGHEKSMNISGRELPWNEVKTVESAIKANL